MHTLKTHIDYIQAARLSAQSHTKLTTFIETKQLFCRRKKNIHKRQLLPTTDLFIVPEGLIFFHEVLFLLAVKKRYT